MKKKKKRYTKERNENKTLQFNQPFKPLSFDGVCNT